MTEPSITPNPPAENLRYLLIDVDNVASIGMSPIAAIRALVGPEGVQRIILDPLLKMAVYVNDSGLALPEVYPRNVVGSAVIGSLGAPQQPYAGPIVVLGWRVLPRWTGRGDADAVSLDDKQVQNLLAVAADIRRVLGFEGGKISSNAKAVWIRSLTRYAEFVRDAEIPGPGHSDMDVLMSMLSRAAAGRGR